jgi:hypothetical protein
MHMCVLQGRPDHHDRAGHRCTAVLVFLLPVIFYRQCKHFGAAVCCRDGLINTTRWTQVHCCTCGLATTYSMLNICTCLCCRDGLITTTALDTGALLSTCISLTGSTSPLQDLALRPHTAAAAAADTAPELGANSGSGSSGQGCVAAAAWCDRLVVFRPPWQAEQADVLCSYKCPQVRSRCACVAHTYHCTVLLFPQVCDWVRACNSGLHFLSHTPKAKHQSHMTAKDLQPLALCRCCRSLLTACRTVHVLRNSNHATTTCMLTSATCSAAAAAAAADDDDAAAGPC